MIGDSYWYTGVKVTHYGGKWGASLDFWDDGFCEDASTQGTLTTRYYLPTPTAAIDTLLADASKLGLVPCNPAEPLHIYVTGTLTGWPADWRRVIGQEAARRGWDCPSECRDAAKGAA